MALAASVLVVGADGASAATVSLRPNSGPSWLRELVVSAAAAEQNRVGLAAMHDGVRQWWTVTDAGAALTPGDGCRRIDEHTAECDADANDRAVVALGDMNDTLRTTWTGFALLSFPPALLADGGEGNDELSSADYVGASVLRGGAGDDQLTAGFGGPAFGDTLDGGPGNDRLVGGRMQDRLRGGGGSDELHAGEGNDWLTDGDRDAGVGDGRPGPDVLDGGPGDDTVSYAERTAAVSVNLADRGTDGEPGEGDVLSQLESIVGGHAHDQLTGDANANQIDGGGGQNRLRGGDGDDQFERARGPVSCGPGEFDLLYGRDSRDFPGPDCERIAPDHEAAGLAPYPEVRRGRLVYRFSCFADPEEGERPACSVTLRIRDTSRRHRLLASGRLRTRPWSRHALTARLTRRGRLAAARRHGVRAIVRVAESGRPPFRWTIRLRVAR